MASRVISLGLSMLVALILARGLGSDGMGIYGYILSLISIIIAISSLGFKQSIILFLKKNNSLINSIFYLSAFISLCVFFLALIFFFYDYFFAKNIIFSNSKLYFLAIFILFSELFLTFLLAIFLGMNHYSQYSKILIAIPSSHLIITITIFILFNINVLNALIAIFFKNLLIIFFLLSTLKSKLSFDFHLNIILCNKMIKNGYIYAIGLFLLTVLYNSNIIILKMFSLNSELGNYIIATKVINIICLLPQTVGTIFFSSNKIEKENDNEMSKLSLFRSSFIIFSIFAIFSFFLIPRCIIIFFGNDYLISAELYRLLIPGLIGLYIIKTIYPDLAGAEKLNVKFFIPVLLFFVIIQVVLNIILISYFSVYGAAITSSIIYSLLAVIIIYKYIDYNGVGIKDVFIPDNKEIISLFKMPSN